MPRRRGKCWPDTEVDSVAAYRDKKVPALGCLIGSGDETRAVDGLHALDTAAVSLRSRLPPGRETAVLHQQPISAPQLSLTSRIAEPQSHRRVYGKHGGLNSCEDGFETLSLAPLPIQAVKQGDTPI